MKLDEVWIGNARALYSSATATLYVPWLQSADVLRLASTTAHALGAKRISYGRDLMPEPPSFFDDWQLGEFCLELV